MIPVVSVMFARTGWTSQVFASVKEIAYAPFERLVEQSLLVWVYVLSSSALMPVSVSGSGVPVTCQDSVPRVPNDGKAKEIIVGGISIVRPVAVSMSCGWI